MKGYAARLTFGARLRHITMPAAGSLVLLLAVSVALGYSRAG